MAIDPKGEVASDASNSVVCRRISKISEAGTLPPEIYQTLNRTSSQNGGALKPDDNVTVVWCVGEGGDTSNMEPKEAAAHHADRKRRRKVAMGACVILFLFGILHIVQAIVVFKMVTNINAGAFWSTSILLFGCLITFLGVYNKKEGLCWMSRGLTLILVGIVLALIGAIVDGVAAASISEIDFSKCIYTDLGKADCDPQGITCSANSTLTLSNINTCYCCYVASRRNDECSFKSVGLAEMPSQFGGVSSCWQVSFMYTNLLWSSVAFSICAAFFAIVVVSLVSAYKTMVTTASVVYTTSSPRPSGTLTTTYAFPTSSATTLPQQRPSSPSVPGPSTSPVYAPVVTEVVASVPGTSSVYAPVMTEVVVAQREESLTVAPTRRISYPVQQVTYPTLEAVQRRETPTRVEPSRRASYPVQQMKYPPPPPRPTAPPTHLTTHVEVQPPPPYYT